MGSPRLGTLLIVTAFLATGCGEQQSNVPTAPEFAQGGGSCNFTTVSSLTKNEFGANSAQAGLATDMKNAGAGTAQATSIGYQILASIGGKYDGTQASTSNASALTVALLNCMDIGGATVPASTVFDAALGANGALGVKNSANTGPVTSHDGAWILQPPGTQTWGSILPVGTSTILVYGVPVSNGTFTNDHPLTGIFDWKTLPDVIFTGNPGVIIGNCTATGYLQHNAVGSGAEILANLGTCPSSGAQLMERAPKTFAERVLRMLSPAPAYAALTTGSTLGGKTHLSPFQVEDITNVNLAAVGFTWSKSGNVVGKPFNPTPVYQLLSGGNTLFHQPDVLVWLEAIGNSGVKVDVKCNWAWTNANGVAQFPAAFLNKSGGYTMIARTIGTNSNGGIPSIPSGNSVLSPLINVKNGTIAGGCTTFHQGDNPQLFDNPGPNGKQ